MIRIRPTSTTLVAEAAQLRLWEGTTDGGIRVLVLALVSVADDNADGAAFAAELGLVEMPPPSVDGQALLAELAALGTPAKPGERPS